MIRLVVPAYFHPAVEPADWALLARSARRLRLVVLNLADGPGDLFDPAFVDVVARIVDAGVAVAGYVDTDYGRKSRRDVLAEWRRYREWYGVDSVFFDRAASGVEHVAHYAALAGAARQCGARLVAFNHGTYPAPEFAEHGDLLGTFEGPWPAFRDAEVPSWVHDLPADRFFNLVYAVTPGLNSRIAVLAAERNVGSALCTDRRPPNPWDHLPADVSA
jgi:spherulation-specific family 4 protein